MTLILRGTHLNDEPISRPLIGRFDERGGTVGRSDDATLTLPDAERLISRTQAQILYRDLHYWIENVSAAGPILHNGRPLSTGMRVVLHDGDDIKIGGYALRTAFEDDEASATILRGRTSVPAPPHTPASAQVRVAPTPVRAAPVAPPAPTPAPAVAPARVEPRIDPGATLAESVYSAPLDDPAAIAATLAAWRGFLDGAGIASSSAPAPTPNLLRSIGEMLKIAVGGLQSLVSMRARVKNEMQAEMTMIQVRDNNPLKFAPDAVLALEMLLQPPARGFLDGPAALRSALTDLQSHQVGMTAGMRSVLEAVLGCLDPVKLEAVQVKRSLLDRLLPSRRKAQLWDMYLAEYRALREEALDNSQRFFGGAFRDAYEAQVRNLEAAPDQTQTVVTAPGRGRST
jgi:predicted component of type VI protein secretion system